MIAVMGALREELLDLQRKMAIERSFRKGGCGIFEGKWGEKGFLLVQTGVGRERAERAAELILDSYPLEALVSLGFAGGVDRRLKAGDLILCATVRWMDGPLEGDKELMVSERSSENLALLAGEALRETPVRSYEGDLLTVPRVVSSRREKEWIGENLPVRAVDMESYWVAKIARAKGVPFLAVRAISDTATDALPTFTQSLDSSGAWRKTELWRYFLVRPWGITCLALKVRRARKSLGAFMDSFMKQVQASSSSKEQEKAGVG